MCIASMMPVMAHAAEHFQMIPVTTLVPGRTYMFMNALNQRNDVKKEGQEDKYHWLSKLLDDSQQPLMSNSWEPDIHSPLSYVDNDRCCFTINSQGRVMGCNTIGDINDETTDSLIVSSREPDIVFSKAAAMEMTTDDTQQQEETYTPPAGTIMLQNEDGKYLIALTRHIYTVTHTMHPQGMYWYAYEIHQHDDNGFCDMYDGCYEECPYNTTDQCYEISKAGHLYYYAQAANAWLQAGNNTAFKKAKLMNDIVVNKGSFDAEGNWSEEGTPRSWTPIGGLFSNFVKPHRAIFDGNGHYVSGLYVNSSSTYVGMFGYVEGNVISNLGVINSFFKSTFTRTDRPIYIAPMVGYYRCGDSAIITDLYAWNNHVVVPNSIFSESRVSLLVNIGSSGCLVKRYYSTGTAQYENKQNYPASGITYDNEAMYKICYTSYDNIFDYSKQTSSAGDYTEKIRTCLSNLSDTQFASGEITMLLNRDWTLNDGLTVLQTPKWYQTIGTDAFPTLDPTHGTVYKHQTLYCNGTQGEPYYYSNDSNPNTTPAHKYNTENVCTLCGYYPHETHLFSKTNIGTTPDANGLYTEICTVPSCTAENDACKVIKGFYNDGTTTVDIEISKREDGTTWYCGEQLTAIPELENIHTRMSECLHLKGVKIKLYFSADNSQWLFQDERPCMTIYPNGKRWQTVCFPFNIQCTNEEGYDLFTIYNVQNNTVILYNKASWSSSNGEPLFIRFDAENVDNNTPVTIYASPDYGTTDYALDTTNGEQQLTRPGDLTFCAVYKDTNVAEEDGYFLYNGRLRQIETAGPEGGRATTITVPAFGAYLKSTAASGAKSLEFAIYGGDTDVTGINPGDLDVDGYYTIADLSLLIEALNDGKSADDIPLADVNGDGKVNIKDVTILRNLLLEEIDSVPTPDNGIINAH